MISILININMYDCVTMYFCFCVCKPSPNTIPSQCRQEQLHKIDIA